MVEVRWPHCLPLYLISRLASTVLRKETAQFTTGTVFLSLCHFNFQFQTKFFNSIELQLKCIICVELQREIPWGAIVKIHRHLCRQRASTSAKCTSNTSATGCCSARWRLAPWRTKEVGVISGFRLPSRGGCFIKSELYVVLVHPKLKCFKN